MPDDAQPIAQEPVFNTFEFSNYTPQRDGRIALTLLSIIRSLTEALYNLDQLFLTPIRVFTWLIGIGAISVVLTTGIAGWVWLVIAPAIFLMGFSVFRAIYASPKAKDIVSLLDKSREGAAKKIRIENTSEAELINDFVLQDDKIPNRYYFLSLYRLDGRYHVTKILISADEAANYQSAENEKLFSLKQDILSRVKVKKSEPPSSFLAWYFKNWIRYFTEDKTNWAALSFWYKFEKRIKFIKENLVEPAFNFLFSAAFVYWVIWSAAFLYGGTAMVTSLIIALPFGSPLIFIAPLVAAVLLYLVKNFAEYRRRNEPENSGEAKHTAEMLVKLALAKKEADAALKLSGLDRTNINARLSEDLKSEASFVDRPRSLFTKVNDFFRGNFSIKNITEVGVTGYRLRIFTHVLVRFAAGFILSFIALWPVMDLVGTQWLGAAAASISTATGIGMLVYVGIAVAVGISYAIYSFANYGSDQDPTDERYHVIEKSRYKKLKDFAGTSLYRQLRQLEIVLERKQRTVKNLRQQISNELLSRAGYFSYFSSFFDVPVGLAKHFLRLLFRKSDAVETEKYDAVKSIKASVLAHNSREFMENLNVWRKSRVLRAWDKLKLFFNRFNEFITAAGSGMLLVRLVFLASTFVGAVFGVPMLAGVLSPLAIGLILGGMGLVWGVLRLCLFLYKRDRNFADMLINQGPAYKDLMENSYRLLCAEEAQLNRCRENAPVDMSSPPSAALPDTVISPTHGYGNPNPSNDGSVPVQDLPRVLTRGPTAVPGGPAFFAPTPVERGEADLQTPAASETAQAGFERQSAQASHLGNPLTA